MPDRGGKPSRRRWILLPVALSVGLVLTGLVVAPSEGWAQSGTRIVGRHPLSSFPAAMRLTPSAREALRRWLCPNGGAPTPGAPGRCDNIRRDARDAAASRSAAGPASDVEGWHRDLPPARGRQAACPEGFKAILARGHADVTRCLPG